MKPWFHLLAAISIALTLQVSPGVCAGMAPHPVEVLREPGHRDKLEKEPSSQTRDVFDNPLRDAARRTAVRTLQNALREKDRSAYQFYDSQETYWQLKTTFKPGISYTTREPLDKSGDLNQGMFFPQIPEDRAFFGALASEHFPSEKDTTKYDIRSVAILDMLPRSTAEFRTIFLKKPSAADETTYERASGKINSTNAPQYFDIAAALSSQNNVIVIVGHNSNGLIRTPKGEVVDVHRLADDCLSASKICIFLTCNSSAYLGDLALGLSDRISITDATKAAIEIVSHLQSANFDPNHPVHSSQDILIQQLRLFMSSRSTRVVVGRRELHGEYVTVGVLSIVVVCQPYDGQCFPPRH
jgi:hypothetical protein